MASLLEYPALMQVLLSRHVLTKVFESLILIILFLLALFGNALVCYVVTRNPRLRTPSNMLVLNLAISDILMAVVCMPLSLGVLLTGKWPYGAALCDMQGFLIFSFGIVSEVKNSDKILFLVIRYGEKIKQIYDQLYSHQRDTH